MRIAWAWDWLVALPVFAGLAWSYWRMRIDMLGVVLGTLLVGGACVGISQALGF